MKFQEQAAKKASSNRRISEKEINDKDVEKLIVVTQNQAGGMKARDQMDKGLASIINDGLARYEVQLQQVGSMPLRICNSAGYTAVCLFGIDCCRWSWNVNDEIGLECCAY